MPLAKEYFPFDAKADEIDALAGSLVSFLQDPNPRVVLLNREVTHKKTGRPNPIFSVYQLAPEQEVVNAVDMIAQLTPIIDIELRKKDCLVGIDPGVFRQDELSWNALWKQFIITRAHFSRIN